MGGVAVTSTAAELNILGGVTATFTELNLIDGYTGSTADLNILDGVTSTTAELNILDGVTSTAAELNILDGVTSTAAELNILDGVTATATEINLIDGVTATTTEINYVDVSTLGTVQASKAVTADSSGNINFNNGNMTNVDINSGAIDGTAIGGSSVSTGAFSTLSTTGDVTQNGATLDTTYLPISSSKEVVTGTTDTLSSTEAGKDLVYTSSSAITVSGLAALAVGFQCTITRAGTGSLTIDPGVDNINGATTDLTIDSQWDTVWIMQYSAGNWLAAGSVS